MIIIIAYSEFSLTRRQHFFMIFVHRLHRLSSASWREGNFLGVCFEIFLHVAGGYTVGIAVVGIVGVEIWSQATLKTKINEMIRNSNTNDLHIHSA
jgi:hypothetical protein